MSDDVLKKTKIQAGAPSEKGDNDLEHQKVYLQISNICTVLASQLAEFLSK